jgi:serine/threonine protein kinase
LTSIRAHGRIHHSALVGVYGVVHGKVIEQGGTLRVVEDPTKWLLVTQFCALGSLSNWLDSIGHGRAQYHEYLAIRLVEEIALGMSMLHERGIVHQDLTIDNVFINDDKHAMISNFGLRAHFDTGSLKDNETLAQGLDRSGLFHLDASSLESGVPNKASDVFAFGVLLHHLFVSKTSNPTLYTDADLQMALATGKRQRTVELFREKMKNGMRPTLGSLDALSPPVKAAISRLLNICLDTHPTNRPSFEEVAVTLHQVRAYLDGQGANNIPATLFPSPTAGSTTPIIMGPAMLPMPVPPSGTFQLLPTVEKIRAGLGIDAAKRLDEALLEAGEILGIGDEIKALKTARERALRIATEMGEL